MADLIRRLAELDDQSQPTRVLSVFVDVNPSDYPTGAQRATQLRSLTDRAAEEARTPAEREAVERVVEAAGDPRHLGAGGTHGLAIYAGGDLLEVVRLGHRIDSGVTWGPTARLEPLLAGDARVRWCVVLVDRRHARLFCGDGDGFEEHSALEASADFERESGDRRGRSEANLQRASDDDARRHLGTVAGTLRKLLEDRVFDRLLVGGPDPVPAHLEEQLHPYVAERLAGRVDADVQSSSAADVLDAARATLERARVEREEELLERLRAGLGREDGHAVGGEDAVHDALEQGRVEVLLLERGGPLSQRPDDVESAIGQAVKQDAEVVVLGDRPDLGPLGGVAALLRF